MYGHPSSRSPRGLAIAGEVAEAATAWDEEHYLRFKEALAYAEHVLSVPDHGMFDVVPLLVVFDSIGLVLRYDKDCERYFVAAVIIDDDRPDPDGTRSFFATPGNSLIEDVLKALRLPIAPLKKDVNHSILAWEQFENSTDENHSLEIMKDADDLGASALVFISTVTVRVTIADVPSEGRTVGESAKAKLASALCDASTRLPGVFRYRMVMGVGAADPTKP